MKELFKILLGEMLIAVASLPTNSDAGGSRDGYAGSIDINGCLEGASPIPSGLACVADKLTFEPVFELANGYEYGLIKVENAIKIDEKTTCSKGEYDLWWDIPVFDKVGIIVGFVKTRSCAVESLSYMPNGAN